MGFPDAGLSHAERAQRETRQAPPAHKKPLSRPPEKSVGLLRRPEAGLRAAYSVSASSAASCAAAICSSSALMSASSSF